MTTGLYLLRAMQAGIAVRDLELLSIGMVYDILTEGGNDGEDYAELASQEDIDRL